MLCQWRRRGKNSAKAVEWYRKAAENGDATAQNNLGVCYEYGTGVTLSKATAAEWYRKAADQGDADAQCNLGYCYENGIGVEKDVIKATEWYQKSAEQGNCRAQCNLAIAMPMEKAWKRTARKQLNGTANLRTRLCKGAM